MYSKIAHPSLLFLGACCTAAVQITSKGLNQTTEDSNPTAPPPILLDEGGSKEYLERVYKVKNRETERHRQWCTKFPSFCAMGCDSDLPADNGTLSSNRMEEWDAGTISQTGQPNTRPLCINPPLLAYYEQCMVNKDLRKFAEHVRTSPLLVHASTEGSRFDGGYCWYSGHCEDETITLDTTSEEATEICDNKFGKGKWAQTYRGTVWTILGSSKRGSIYHDAKEANIYAKATCGLGLYHCDVIRCRETLCKTDEYRQSFNKSAKTL